MWRAVRMRVKDIGPSDLIIVASSGPNCTSHVAQIHEKFERNDKFTSARKKKEEARQSLVLTSMRATCRSGSISAVHDRWTGKALGRRNKIQNRWIQDLVQIDG